MPLLTDPSAILSFYLVGLEAWRRLLGIATGIPIQNLDSFRQAVERRLDFDVFEVLQDLVLLKGLLTD